MLESLLYEITFLEKEPLEPEQKIEKIKKFIILEDKFGHHRTNFEPPTTTFYPKFVKTCYSTKLKIVNQTAMCMYVCVCIYILNTIIDR